MRILKLVTLLDPEMCDNCRFKRTGEATVNGETKPTIICKRLDCDNWCYSDAIPIESVKEDKE